MISKKDFKKLSEWLWEISKSFREDMRVPARRKILPTYLLLFVVLL